MLKAGLITGVLAIFVAAIAAYFISPLCAPCAMVLLGAASGYLANVFDRPAVNNEATKKGALGGAIGGAGALIGQLIGAGLNAYFIGPEGAAEINRSLGLPSGGPGLEQGYWMGLIGGAVCLSIVDILIMAGFGALGGILWWQMSGKKMIPPAPPIVS